MTQFETSVVEYLTINGTGSLWWMSDFYELCCKELSLDFSNIKENQTKIRYRLSKMKKNGKIDVRRTSNGIGSKGLFGTTSNNTYTLPDFWLD